MELAALIFFWLVMGFRIAREFPDPLPWKLLIVVIWPLMAVCWLWYVFWSAWSRRFY